MFDEGRRAGVGVHVAVDENRVLSGSCYCRRSGGRSDIHSPLNRHYVVVKRSVLTLRFLELELSG